MQSVAGGVKWGLQKCVGIRKADSYKKMLWNFFTSTKFILNCNLFVATHEILSTTSRYNSCFAFAMKYTSEHKESIVYMTKRN